MAQQETSALFSLKELMRLEDQRIRDEAEARRREAEVHERERIEAERAARDRDAALAREREEAKRREEAKAREEAARLQAIRDVERERVGLERMRTEALAVARENERRVAALVERSSRPTRRGWLAFAATGVVAFAMAMGYLAVKRDRDQHASELDSLLAASRAESARVQQALAAENDRMHELEEQLRPVREAQKTPPPAEPKVEHPGTRRVPKPAPPPPPCSCDPHDPLCGCFNR